MSIRMNPDLRDAWCNALRSGKYEQLRGELTDGMNCHCCLGVLAIVAGVDLDDDDEEVSGPVEEGMYYGDRTGLGYNDAKVLVHINDSDDGYDFDDIADFIEGEGW